jgi:type IV secretion system protein VirD4
VHGTARFGNDADLRHAGLLPEPGGVSEGVYCGAWQDKRGTLHYLRHNGPEHVLALGPIRSGKLVGLVVPTMTTWPHSAVVYDEKGEIFEATAGWRASEGENRVLRWEPGTLNDTVRFNFMDEVRLGTEYEFRDVSNIMELVVDPKGAGLSDHWKPSAAVTLNGVALHVCYERRAAGGTASLGDVLNALNDPRRGRDQLYEAMRTNVHLNGQPHPQIAAVGQDMMNKDVRERSGIHSTASLMLRLFRDPIVAGNTARSDFRINELMDAADPVTLYIVTRGEDKLRLRPLVRLFLTMMFNRLCSAHMKMDGGDPATPHRHRLLVLIDEFASLRRMEAVQEALSKAAGYGKGLSAGAGPRADHRRVRPERNHHQPLPHQGGLLADQLPDRRMAFGPERQRDRGCRGRDGERNRRGDAEKYQPQLPHRVAPADHAGRGHAAQGAPEGRQRQDYRARACPGVRRRPSPGAGRAEPVFP